MLETCGHTPIKPNTFSKIVGGVVAKANSWPWQVSVQVKTSDSFDYFCGGSIIGRTKVISAAHCFFDNDGNLMPIIDLRLIAGIHSISESYKFSQMRKVVKLINHPKYNPFESASANDIAVLIVETEYIYGKKVQPVCLPNSPIPVNSDCYTTGWGDIAENEEDSDDKLRQVKVPIIPYDTCKSWYGNSFNKSMICAGYAAGGKDSCQGDSGGPLVCQRGAGGSWVLDGIVSWGYGCGKPNNPGVYTKVKDYISWIDSIN